MLRRRIPLFVLLTVLGIAGLAQAQTNPQELSDANRSAMDAYNNLDIESAKKQLEEAAKNAEKNGVKGPALARTYANLGIIYVGGLSDNGAGLDAFVKALKQDPNVEPDPLVSTPEIQQVYTLAKRKAGVSGGGSSAPSTPAVTGPVEGNLEHIPAPEQLSQTAVPVFVTVGDLPVASVKVFYRALGMPQPKSLDLKPMRNGWGALIPCTDVFEPNVEYFIVALDDEGAQVGNAGTPQNPVSVPIVTTRSSPSPSLPGELPPSQCTGETECPPGMPGCHGRAGLGDTCRADKDCGEGLVCQDNFCATGERSGDDEDEADTSDVPRFYLDLSFGVGMPYVGEGMEADAAPPANVAVAACNVGYGNEPNPPNSNGQCITSGTLDLTRAQQYTEDRGWACEVVETADGGITLRNCTVAIQSPGFVPQPVLNFGFGYFITPRFSLGLAGRVQFGAGEGTLAGIVASVRGEYLVTQPKVKGFQTGLLFGAGVGRIMAQPPAQTDKAKGPYVTSGLGGVQLGARIGYRVSRNIGLNVVPTANFMLPAFLFDLDLLANVQILF